MVNKADIHAQFGNHAEAARAYDDVLSIEPDNKTSIKGKKNAMQNLLN